MSRTSHTPRIIALIPARAGSSRIPHKNIRPLAGHPLIAYTIASAQQSEIFSDIVVSTDSPQYAEIAQRYGAEVPFLRPAEYARETSPDIDWVSHTLTTLHGEGRGYDCFSILRPTSPFRRAETIHRAWREFLAEKRIDSLRAVERCAQHPGKMWVVHGKRMKPLLSGPSDPPWHSRPYQVLPEVYAQNGSLEIAWTRVVFEDRSIAGREVMPFFMPASEGFDLNGPDDWLLAETLLHRREVRLPRVEQSADIPGVLPQR